MSTINRKEAYKGKNGFLQIGRGLPRDFAGPSENIDDPESIEAQELAGFILSKMGSPFPSLEEMKQAVETPETIASVKELIAKLKEEHKQDLAKIHNYHVQSIIYDAIDRCYQTDSTKYFDDLPDDNEWRQDYIKLETLYRTSSKIRASEFKNIIECYRYDYLQKLLPLYKRCAELERAEKEARMNRAAKFPQNINDYRSIDVPAAQLRVARFLMSDDSKRETMMTESHWIIQETKPLTDVYQSDPEFQAEVQKTVVTLGSRDPRNRPTANLAT